MSTEADVLQQLVDATDRNDRQAVTRDFALASLEVRQ